MDTRLRHVLPCALLALAGCGGEPAEVAAEPVVVKHAMAEVMTPRSDELINILIDAMGDQGGIDPAKLTDENWSAMAAAAAALREEAAALRDRPIRVVAAEGDTIEGEGSPGALTASDVQAVVDARPAEFRAMAEALLADYERLAAAVDARDAATVWDVTLNLDAKCTACHLVFWNPQAEAPAP